VIAGKHVCLRAGQRCNPKLNSQYRRYKLQCQGGRLRSAQKPPQPRDIRPPETTITSGPPGSTTETSASFSFSADEPATFECRLDSGSYEPCTPPKSYVGLAVGGRTFEVRAIDAAGNRDQTPATHAWTITAPIVVQPPPPPPIDPPSPPIDPPPPPADMTPPETVITSAPMNFSFSTAASFSFVSTEDGSTFECRLDEGAFEPCTSPKTYTGLAYGPHRFEVRARDAAGNVDETPAIHLWEAVADTRPPLIAITSGPALNTSDTSATFTFMADEPGSTFECRLNGGPFEPCTSPKTYTALGPGSHFFELTASDPAGNRNPTPVGWGWNLTTSTQPPPPPPPPPKPQCSDGIDNDGDGRTDYPNDSGCSSATDDSEAPDAYACEPSYPTVCIRLKTEVGDLNCSDIPYRRFRVRHDVPNPDPHRFDGDKDGIGCES
jgi:large repetitive protein